MSNVRLLWVGVVVAVSFFDAGCHGGANVTAARDAGPSRDAGRGEASDAARTDGGAPLEAGPPFAGLTVFVTASNQQLAASFFEFLPEAKAEVTVATDPLSASASSATTGLRVAAVTDLGCGECYRLAGSGDAYEVHAGGALGAQYGLAELLEALGFRFFHPWQSRIPLAGEPVATGRIGPLHTPQLTVRGLHLHTLHPIEGYYALWATGAGDPPPDGGASDAGAGTGLDGARRIVDWIVKNRGNYLEWSALNNIVSASANDLAAWHAHTAAIIAYAHARGIQIGIGVELFGDSNLQQAFDLLDHSSDMNAKADADARLHLLLDGLPWDVVDVSFGEFSSSDPMLFLTSLNLAYDEIESMAPGTVVAATIHDGNSPSLEVTYDGQQLLYYFLVQYADPHIVPFIHTVMYFDLFQPADGAYNMPNFDQHLAYLQQRMSKGLPVAYYPESAYWVSFDDSVPTYLPVYMRSRWLDLSQLASAAAQGGYPGLAQHVLFSSGWEWGYWQNDYATLRMNFEVPAAWTDTVTDMFAPWGAAGATVAAQIGVLGELESKYLIDQKLAAYMAGQDQLLALGAVAGIVSQPTRTSLADLAAMSAVDRATFSQSVLTPLASMASELSAVQEALAASHLDPNDPWLREVTDGVDIDLDRVRFVGALYQGVMAFASTGSDAGWLAKADAALSDAKKIVKARDAALHFPTPSLLLGPTTNFTLYQTGYLTEAGTLCLWARERIQAGAIVANDPTTPPGCVP